MLHFFPINANCFAYMDPNAGGWLFQLVFPVMVAIGGVWLVLREKAGALWKRVFGQRKKKRDDGL